MSVAMKGVDGAIKVYAKVDKRITKERQGIFRTVARRVILPQMKFEAEAAPGRAGPRLARATVVRNGKQGAVLVGPKGGKSRGDRGGAWFRAIYITGHASPYPIPKASGKTRGRRARRVLYNPNGPFVASATRGVTHPPIVATPFVERAQRATERPFTEALTKALYPEAT